MIQPILMPPAARRLNGFLAWDGPSFTARAEWADGTDQPKQQVYALCIGRAFKEEAIRQHGGGNVADVFGRHAASEETVAPVPDHFDNPINLRVRLLRRQSEAARLRQQVIDAGGAAIVATVNARSRRSRLTTGAGTRS